MDVFLRWRIFFYGKQQNTSQKREALSPLSPSLAHSPSSSNLYSSVPFLFPPSLFPLWEIMWLFDLRRDEWQWFSKSSPVSITLRVKYQPWVCVCVSACMHKCVCVRTSVYVPCLTITPLGSVTLWQKALIFQFYHTPLSQLSPSCSLPYHPHSPDFFFISQTCPRHTHTHTHTHTLTHIHRHTHTHTHTHTPSLSVDQFLNLPGGGTGVEGGETKEMECTPAPGTYTADHRRYNHKKPQNIIAAMRLAKHGTPWNNTVRFLLNSGEFSDSSLVICDAFWEEMFARR